MASDVQGNTTTITSSMGDAETGMGRTQQFTYDPAQRLTAVADTIGEQCTTRTYGFDLRGNRLAQSAVTHAVVGDAADSCATAADATVAKTWTYDTADRVQSGATIAGTAGGAYVYDGLGRQTTVPAVDSPKGSEAGDVTLGYFDTDAARTLSQAGLTTTFALDPAGRRQVETTTGTRADGTTADDTLTRHYVDSSDNPGWATSHTADGDKTTWYGASIGGDLAIQATTTASGPAVTSSVDVTLVDTLGSAATTITVGADTPVGAVGLYDEYGNTIQAATGDGAINYGWLGGKERATDNATGLVLMGARLYNSTTGLFTSVDPVPGGNTTAYAYPQDPINSSDADGQRRVKKSWWSRNWKWVAAAAVVVAVAAVCVFATAACGAAASAALRVGARLVAPAVRAARVARSMNGRWSSRNTVVGIKYVSQKYGNSRYMKLDRPDKARPYYHVVRGKIQGRGRHVALNHWRVSRYRR